MFGWFKRSPEETFARSVYQLVNAFPYKSERYETLFSVPLCLARGGGDCDDKANMFYEALKAWGFAPQVVHGRYKGVRHAAVICRINGKEYAFCNAHGRLISSDDYLGIYMTDYKVLSEDEYLEWCEEYAIDR